MPFCSRRTLPWGPTFSSGGFEVVGKTAGDLAIPQRGEEIFTAGKLTAGYVREFGSFARLVPGIGIGISVSFVPIELEPFYGSRFPVSFVVFTQLHPARTEMGMNAYGG